MDPSATTVGSDEEELSDEGELREPTPRVSADLHGEPGRATRPTAGPSDLLIRSERPLG